MSRLSIGVVLFSFIAITLASPHAGRAQPAVDSGSLRSRVVLEAQILIRAGKFSDALNRLQSIPTDSKGDLEIAILRGTCLRRLGRGKDAAELYRTEADALISRSEDATPMLVELERVYREEKVPEKAFDVCLEIHRNGKSRAAWVLDEMESLIKADSLGERAIPALRREIERRPQASDLGNLLAGALLFLGRTDEALRFVGELDRSRDAHGGVLLEHVRLLDRKGLGEPAISAADAAIDAGLRGGDLQEALYLRACALRRIHRFPEASSGYERAAEAAPNGPLARVALRDRADLLVRDMSDLAGGSNAYQALITDLEKGPSTREQGKLLGQSLVALADCKLRLGRYEEAAGILAKVEAISTDAEAKEEAAFQQAEILFYAGKADTAAAAYGRVVKQFPGGMRVNDALKRILLLTRSAGAGPLPVAALGQIAYQKRNGSPQRVLEICTEAEASCGGCAAAEDLLREESLALLDLGRIDEAVQRADTLAARYPSGGAAPEVLRAVADRMRQRDGDTDAVIRRYEDLLARFPQSHDAYEVRPQLERMRRSGSSVMDEPREIRG